MISAIGLFDAGAANGAGTSGVGFGSFSQAVAEPDVGSFGDLLAAAAGRTVGTLRHAESMSARGLQGDADIREVVDAVMSAEQSLQAAVSIRDKIVSAYLDISRMAI